jgi:hypothetical protein
VNNVGSKTLFNPVFIDNLIVFSRVSSACCIQLSGSDNFGFSRCFVDIKMFIGEKLFCYNRAWIEQYVESENSKGKWIKIGFSAYF